MSQDQPERIGPYRVIDLLGRGGLGAVYRAFDERTSEVVAVKLLTKSPATDERAVQRFNREFQALAAIDHPYVVKVYEAGVEGDLPWYSMELVDGVDLKRHVDLVGPDPLSSVSGDALRAEVARRRGAARGAAPAGAETGAADAGGAETGAAPVGGGTTQGARSSGAYLEAPSGGGDEETALGQGDEETAVAAFGLDAWAEEADTEALVGGGHSPFTPSEEVLGAVGPAPSVDMPYDRLAAVPEPLDLPDRTPDLEALNRPMRLLRIRELLVQVCGALGHIHSRGLVHRDLKPSNILVDADGDARLMDFGLVKTLAALDDPSEDGRAVGTYRYMSPEQAAGEPVDARSDLYSLGVVLYELLTGRPPFLATNPFDLWHELLETEPPSIISLNPLVDRPLAHLAHALLRKDPRDRPQLAEEVEDFLLHEAQ